MDDSIDPRIERTRARALDAAAAIIREGGVASCTMQRVSARTGISRSTLYRHWPEPTDLALAALEEIAGPPAGPAPATTGDLLTDLEHLATGLRAALAGPWGLTVAQLIGAAATDPAARAIHLSFTTARIDHARTILEAAVDRGELARLPDVVDVVARLMGPIYYRQLLAREPADDEHARALARSVHETLTRG